MVQGQRRETGEAKVHLTVPDGSLVGRDDRFGEPGGTARVDDCNGEEELYVGAERWVPVCLVWVCDTSLGSEYVRGRLVNDRY